MYQIHCSPLLFYSLLLWDISFCRSGSIYVDYTCTNYFKSYFDGSFFMQIFCALLEINLQSLLSNLHGHFYICLISVFVVTRPCCWRSFMAVIYRFAWSPLYLLGPLSSWLICLPFLLWGAILVIDYSDSGLAFMMVYFSYPHWVFLNSIFFFVVQD